MKILEITPQTVIEMFTERYKGRNNEDVKFDLEGMRNKLKILKNPTLNDIERILNKSWTSGYECNECEKDHSVVISIGKQTSKYENTTVEVCLDCFNSMVQLVQEYQKGNKK